MNRICLVLLLTSVLHSAVVVAADSDSTTTIHETAGFGIGALIGGLVAGPPGAVIGAAGGTLYGNHNAKKDVRVATLQQQLHEKNIEFVKLQQEFSNAQFTWAENLKKVALDKRRASLKKLSDNISFSVYFRTDDSGLDPTLTPHIRDLVNLILESPGIKVQLEAHADRRGRTEHNMKLSLARAYSVRNELIRAGLPTNRIQYHAYGESHARSAEGDIEGCIFDRRVDLLLTLDSEI